MRYIAFLFCAFLSACAPQSGVLTAPEAGLSGGFTRQIVISDHPNHVLMGHLIDVTRAETRTRALVIGQRRDGVHRLRMSEAWTNGVALPFAPTHRRLDGCTHGHCLDSAIGLIFLSDPLFEDARLHGLSARLLGSSAAIDISVPASLFQALPE